MKIVVDKQYTTLDKVSSVKADIKEFKERYTEKDLLRLFVDAVCTAESEESVYYIAALQLSGREILSVSGEAFPGDYHSDYETSFSVGMTLDGYNTMYKIHFYISLSGKVDTRYCENLFGNNPYRRLYQIKEFNLSNEF